MAKGKSAIIVLYRVQDALLEYKLGDAMHVTPQNYANQGDVLTSDDFENPELIERYLTSKGIVQIDRMSRVEYNRRQQEAQTQKEIESAIPV